MKEQHKPTPGSAKAKIDQIPLVAVDGRRHADKKVYIKTFGCQMNEYDSTKMADILQQKDAYTLTDNAENAEVIIFNTCSIREKAQEKLFSDLGRMKRLKEHNNRLIIAVGGCVASQEGAEILKRAPYVDIVFGPQTLHRLPQLIDQRKKLGTAQLDISFPEIEKFDNLPPPSTQGATAFVSIMEGCSKYCSYCIVPYTRGEEISRLFVDIIDEITQLSLKGVKEVNLLGQNVNAYRGRTADGNIADFALLLEHVQDIPGIERIRFTTSHPAEMTSRIINCFGTLPKLTSHLHLPVQSGSDKILAAMKRGYTVLQYKHILKQIKALRPDISFSTDFIVGFPGESEQDFNQTLKLAEEIGYDTSFSFIYSPRPGTPSSLLPDITPLEVKQQRLQQLQEVLKHSARQISDNMVNKTYKVLVEGTAKKDAQQLSGRTENFKTVNFNGAPSLINQIVAVTITESLNNSLRGQLAQ